MDTEILEALKKLANELSAFAALSAYHAGQDYELRDHAERLENKAELLAELIESKMEKAG